MEPPEFDRLLMGFRIYCRDYEVTEEDQAILAVLEEAGARRETGGIQTWTPPGWDEESPEEQDGGAAVPA